MDLVCVAFPAGRIDDVIAFLDPLVGPVRRDHLGCVDFIRYPPPPFVLAFLDPLVGPVRRAGRRCVDFIRRFIPLISFVNLPPPPDLRRRLGRTPAGPVRGGSAERIRVVARRVLNDTELDKL